MSLKIHYFASIREAVDKAEEQVHLPVGVATVADLQTYLAAQNAAFKSLYDSGARMLVAVNQTVVDGSYQLGEDDEVAFFPPMTGG